MVLVQTLKLSSPAKLAAARWFYSLFSMLSTLWNHQHLCSLLPEGAGSLFVPRVFLRSVFCKNSWACFLLQMCVGSVRPVKSCELIMPWKAPIKCFNIICEGKSRKRIVCMWAFVSLSFRYGRGTRGPQRNFEGSWIPVGKGWRAV